MLSPTETESHMQVGTVVQAIVSNPRNLQVDDLKQQIAHTTGVPADMLRLVHKGKAIHNDHVVSLSDQGIDRYQTSSVVVRRPGLFSISRQYVVSGHRYHPGNENQASSCYARCV